MFRPMLTTTFRPFLHHIRVCGSWFLFCSVSRSTQHQKSVVEPSGHLTFPFSSSCICIVSHLSPHAWSSSVFPVFVHSISIVFTLWESNRSYTNIRSMRNPHFHHAIVGIWLVQIDTTVAHMIELSKLRRVMLLFYNFIIYN